YFTILTHCIAHTPTLFPYTTLFRSYTTYRESGSGADTTFNWIITPTPENATEYVISSSNNPFALDFDNASLSLIHQGQSSEAYTDRKSTRLNSSHLGISYAVFCLKK